jgi:hypothetical protein
VRACLLPSASRCVARTLLAPSCFCFARSLPLPCISPVTFFSCLHALYLWPQTPVAHSIASPVRNLTDPLLAACRIPLWAGLAKRVGIPVPIDLHRGSWSDKRIGVAGVSLAGRHVAVVHLPGSPAAVRRDEASVLQALSVNGAVVVHGGGKASLDDRKVDGVVLDCGTFGVSHAQQLFSVAQPLLRSVRRGGKVTLLAHVDANDVDASRVAVAGLHGFVASLAKELGFLGTAVNCVVETSAQRLPAAIAGPLSFFQSTDCAFVTGQTLVVTAPEDGVVTQLAVGVPGLAGKVAVVTGAARGIGAAIATRLAHEGAVVFAADIPEVSHF